MDPKPLETGRDWRVTFAGGGTGGHIMPGAATAQTIRRLVPGARCLFLVTPRESERHCRRALQEFEIAEVPAAQWRGVRQKAEFALASIRAAERCVELMRRSRPNVLVGLGGYSCVTPVIVAKALGVPVMLFESNALPGRVVRALAPLADCVQVQWAEAGRRLRARRILVSGNPVRPRLFTGERHSARQRLGLHPRRLALLVLGGSQGALALNDLTAQALRHLAGSGVLRRDSLQVLHITGPDHLEAALKTDAPEGVIWRRVGFIEHMEDAYAAADVVLARAGGSTLAELTALGLPSLLVPYPHATEDHQTANAAVLARARAAVALKQSELDGEKLARLLGDLANCPEWLADMSARARAIGRPDAARTVAAELAALSGFKMHPAQPGSGRPAPHDAGHSTLSQAA